MRRSYRTSIVLVLALLVCSAMPVLAQDGQQPGTPELTLITSFPGQTMTTKDAVTIELELRAATTPQIVNLRMRDAPQGWTTSFRGGGRVIHAAYVEPDRNAIIQVKLEPAAEVGAGTYRFVVVAEGDTGTAELPLELTVQDKLPSRMTFDIDLPNLTGQAGTIFRYSATLKNEGEEDLSVNLVSDAPTGFRVTFQLVGTDVTGLTLEAGLSKSLAIQVRPPADTAAGDYPITVTAQAPGTEAKLNLTAHVKGEPTLTMSGPEGQLSGRAYIGRESTLNLTVSNTGTAPALELKLSSSAPTGWSVTFAPDEIPLLEPNQQTEVTVSMRPSEKAVAGDYMITLRASGEEGASASAEFRITVLTSTLWGVVGIALIAVAVGVVGLAVMRFGRR